jgi:hypothetical protein
LVFTTVGGFLTFFGMARKLRVEYPGAIYHVMNRGDRREAIFKDDKDRERFLKGVGKVSERCRFLVLTTVGWFLNF